MKYKLYGHSQLQVQLLPLQLLLTLFDRNSAYSGCVSLTGSVRFSVCPFVKSLSANSAVHPEKHHTYLNTADGGEKEENHPYMTFKICGLVKYA